MGIICSPQKQNPTLQDLITQQTNRDIGLSSVFNVNTNIVSCIERYESPEYIMSGSCKPVTGLTIGCPDGYTMEYGNDVCVKITTTGATATAGSGTTITAGTVTTQNGSLGTYFYENIQNRKFPISRIGPTEYNLTDSDGYSITATNIVVHDTFWDSNGSTTQGRLNLTGIYQAASEFRGVSYCFVEHSATTYYIGYGTGNGSGTSRLTIDGEVIIDTESSIDYDYKIWNVIPWYFTSGKHIIEYEANTVNSSAIEVYKPNSLGQLTGATTSGDTGVVFSTAYRVGTPYDLGITAGYTCFSGYSMDTCGTGLTCTLLDYTDLVTVEPDCYYNLSEVEDFNLIFNFTGSTQYTGYTGEFCYTLDNQLPAKPFVPVCTPYSGITGSTLVGNLGLSDLSRVDNEYILHTWNVFESQCKEGLTIDTSKYIPRNTDGDYYFITTVNPPVPILQQIPNNIFEGISFMNETIFPQTNGSNTFVLNSPPVGNTVVVSVNGITIKDSDYTVSSVDSKLVTFVSGITLEKRDVVQAYYNKSTSTSSEILGVNSPVKLEMFAVTGISTDVISNFSATTYENIVNYNTESERLEVFLTEKIDPAIEPVVTINGVNVAYNYDVFKSNIVDNKLVFAEGVNIKTNDVISVYYYYSGFNSVGDLGQLLTDTVTINWTSQLNLIPDTIGSYGRFTVEAAYADDPTFSNPSYFRH